MNMRLKKVYKNILILIIQTIMKTNFKKSYVAPTLEVVEVKMNSVLLGSNTDGAYRSDYEYYNLDN